jgi:glycerol-3-phosphate dehydrogenase
MDRQRMIASLEEGPFDVVVVGGGATGLGVAVDAQTRGYRTLLLERSDFAKATSSRSTKLVHGGVRYLQQGNVSLVLEALRERGLLVRNAPHLVQDLAFVVPRYRWWEGPFYGIGLKLYDRLAGRLNIAPSRLLDREQTISRIPNVARDSLLGGVVYHDAQFDDARMALALARTAADHGASLLNYFRVEGLVKEASGAVAGVVAVDQETGRAREVRARVVVNATGVFSDEVRRMDDPAVPGMIAPAQGVHLVLDRSFLAGDTAIMVPHTDDGRVLFVIPWQDRVLVGTTDTEVPRADVEPRPLAEEIGFILRNAARYLEKDPVESDCLSVFAGLRPLVREPSPGPRPRGRLRGRSQPGHSKSISREHAVIVSQSGLVSVVGGKWTTYRKMAQDTVDDAVAVGGLPERACVTEELRLHGWLDRGDPALPQASHLRSYGADATALEAFLDEVRGRRERLHPRLPYVVGQVAWAARLEMARTVEDVLARRTRALLLDARAAVECAPRVAAELAAELGRDARWAAAQVEAFRELAEGYLPPGSGDADTRGAAAAG